MICVNSGIKILCKYMVTYFSFLNILVINLQHLGMGHIFLRLEQMPDKMHVFLVNMMYFNIYNTYVLDKNSQPWMDKTTLANNITYLLTYLLHGAESFLRS